jgi:hypothetical protein
MKLYKTKIFTFIVVVILLIGIGVSFYEPPKKADKNKNVTKSYFVEWEIRESSLSTITDFASKNTCYEREIVLKQANLKRVIFDIKWEDDKTIFGLFGLDCLTLTIISPEGTTYEKDAKSALKTKDGNIVVEIPVNDIPSNVPINSEDIYDAKLQLNKEPYYNDKWVNKAFTVKVRVTVGEIFGKIRPGDKGNNFDLKIKYEYYSASVEEDDFSNFGLNNENDFKESGYIPPSMCHWCKDYSSFRHRGSCPHYRSPFECSWCNREHGHRPGCPRE